jgi:hypothetical protein
MFMRIAFPSNISTFMVIWIDANYKFLHSDLGI